MNTPINRRTFLKGVGAVIALPALEFTSGAAEKTAFPVRMAHLYMANGVHPDMWTPKCAGREFELSPTLTPLADVKNEILVLSELWNAASNTGDGHYVKTSGYLTSTTITRTTGEALNSNGVSMDQLAAQKIGILTPLPSLELGLEPPATGVDTNVGYTQLYGAHIAWNQPTIPLAKEINPKQAFDRLFRPKAVTAREAADVAAGRDRSVLDLVSADARRLQRSWARAIGQSWMSISTACGPWSGASNGMQSASVKRCSATRQRGRRLKRLANGSTHTAILRGSANGTAIIPSTRA